MHHLLHDFLHFLKFSLMFLKFQIYFNLIYKHLPYHLFHLFQIIIFFIHKGTSLLKPKNKNDFNYNQILIIT